MKRIKGTAKKKLLSHMKIKRIILFEPVQTSRYAETNFFYSILNIKSSEIFFFR